MNYLRRPGAFPHLLMAFNCCRVLLQLKLHPGAALAAVVCTDRKVYIVNMSTGECEACLSGMSGIIADVAFSSDCRL